MIKKVLRVFQVTCKPTVNPIFPPQTISFTHPLLNSTCSEISRHFKGVPWVFIGVSWMMMVVSRQLLEVWSDILFKGVSRVKGVSLVF